MVWLPWKKSRLQKAVKKCFHRAVGALQKSEAVEAARTAQNAPEDPLKTLKEKLGQCKLCAVTPRKKVSEQEVEQRQKISSQSAARLASGIAAAYHSKAVNGFGPCPPSCLGLR
jgi:hypothetical protein